MTGEWVDEAVAVQQAWTRAFEARDLKALSALYTEETAFYGSTTTFYTTPDGVRTYFELLPPSYKRSAYEVPHVVPLGDDAMAATGEVTFYREEADGTVTALPLPYDACSGQARHSLEDRDASCVAPAKLLEVSSRGPMVCENVHRPRLGRG